MTPEHLQYVVTCSRNQKRKYEDDHGAEHGNFDMTEIREHEEFTKVKNIERIELGRYEMETWYFSPFPEEFKECTVRPTLLFMALYRLGLVFICAPDSCIRFFMDAKPR